MRNSKRKRPGQGRARVPARKRASYFHTVRLVRDSLHPVEPPPRLIIEIRNLGQAFGTDELLLDLVENSRKKRRSLIIGGICSSLPIFGMASYALARYYQQQHRRGIEADNGLMTPA